MLVRRGMRRRVLFTARSVVSAGPIEARRDEAQGSGS